MATDDRERPGDVGTDVWRFDAGRVERLDDRLTVEEPLEIRLSAGGEQRTLTVTMRTPGADAELAAGLLFAEQLVHSRREIRRIVTCAPEAALGGAVEVELELDRLPPLDHLERHLFASSACGICGKAALETLRLRGVPEPEPGGTVAAEVLTSLPDKLRPAQSVFTATGGLHAAALFDFAGNLRVLREDVGRHNAVDKLVGWALAEDLLPLSGHVVLASGRAGFEILQKCLMAGVPVVCSVSAPSSLAVALARRFGITLIGFLRGERFNVYSGIERLATPVAKAP